MYGAQPEGLTQVEAWNWCGALMIFMGGGIEKTCFRADRFWAFLDSKSSWYWHGICLGRYFFLFRFVFFLRFTRIHFFCDEQKNRIMSVGVSVALILFMNVEVVVSLCAGVVSEVAVRWGCDLARRRPLGASLLEMLFDGSSRSCEMKASTERISFRCDCCFPAESKLFAWMWRHRQYRYV